MEKFQKKLINYDTTWNYLEEIDRKPNCMSSHSHDIVEISKSDPNNLFFFIFNVFFIDISLFLFSIISFLSPMINYNLCNGIQSLIQLISHNC